MRLDKFICNATDLSRSQVRKAVKSGLVSINGNHQVRVNDPIADGDQVCLDGEPVQTPGHRYFMLHKPLGVVSATKDSDNPTVIDLLDEPNKDRLQIAGRLDIDTTGLVLITDDGQWNHRVTSPRRQCHKTYAVTTNRDIDPESVAQFEQGLWLEGEKRRTLPATLELLYSNEARLTISEGKYHQVKRMFAATGNHVDALHRERIGDIELDPALAPGEYRPLTRAEIDSIQ